MTAARREVLIEQLGQRHDDVLISFRYDAEMVKILRELPHWAAHWDVAAWRLHPAFIAELINAAALRGYKITATNRRP